MKSKFGIKEVVAIGIGTALFVALTEVQIPLGFIPNTALQPRAALMAFLAAVFGPVVGGIVAPVLDIVIYAEPAGKVFAQGAWAFLGNIIIVGILGTLIAVGYSKIGGKTSSLSRED